VIVFAGPSGHGKTELARIMGALLLVPSHFGDCTEMRHETDLFGPKAPYENWEVGSPLNNHLIDARYNAETQQQLIYWRKGMFAIGRKCICGESFTLSHAERCSGTHMKMEKMIAPEEYSNVKYYINAI